MTPERKAELDRLYDMHCTVAPPPAKPIYCKECGDFRVHAKGDVCTFCTICAVRGEDAAEAWWLEQHNKAVIA